MRNEDRMNDVTIVRGEYVFGVLLIFNVRVVNDSDVDAYSGSAQRG